MVSTGGKDVHAAIASRHDLARTWHAGP